MNEFFSNLLVFCIILVFYLHIFKHKKISNDLEVYEIMEVTKDRLEDVLETLQPVVFKYETFLNLDAYHSFDVRIRNVNDQDNDLCQLYLYFSLSDALKLFTKDTSMNYFSENNADFLVDTGLTKTIEMRDDIFRPTSMVSRITYDIMLGSAGVSTPFRYHINNRYFILVLEGSAKIKIAPPKSSKYMDCIYDYDNFEFRSKEGPPRQVKTMDIKLSTHEVLFIPPYWWYSITFDTASTKLLCYSYQTIMSTLSISPQLFMHLLQSNNIKRNNYTKLCT